MLPTWPFDHELWIGSIYHSVAYVSDYSLSLIGLVYGKNHRKPYGPMGFSPSGFRWRFSPTNQSSDSQFPMDVDGESCPAGFLAGAMVWAKPTTKRWGCRALHRCQMGNQAVIELDDGNYGNIYRKALAYDGKNHGFRLRFPQQTNPWNERKNILKKWFHPVFNYLEDQHAMQSTGIVWHAPGKFDWKQGGFSKLGFTELGLKVCQVHWRVFVLQLLLLGSFLMSSKLAWKRCFVEGFKCV